MLSSDLPERLAERLVEPLSEGAARERENRVRAARERENRVRAARERMAPELAYGRHNGPPRYDARAAAVLALLYPDAGQWYLPLTLRPDALPAHAGQISLPGGVIESGESIEQAALRELEEELGVPAADVRILGRLSPLYVFASNFSVTPIVGATKTRPEFTPHAAEVAELVALPLACLVNESSYGTHLIRRRGLAFTAPHITCGHHQIWGATSIILAELAGEVKTTMRG